MNGTIETGGESTRMDSHGHPSAQSDKDGARFPEHDSTRLAWILEQAREVFGGEITVVADGSPGTDNDLGGNESEEG
jgi:hypothetical protein